MRPADSRHFLYGQVSELVLGAGDKTQTEAFRLGGPALPFHFSQPKTAAQRTSTTPRREEALPAPRAPSRTLPSCFRSASAENAMAAASQEAPRL